MDQAFSVKGSTNKQTNKLKKLKTKEFEEKMEFIVRKRREKGSEKMYR